MESYVRKQATINRAVKITGKGYWSGIEIDVEFRPAAENRGITFVRTDVLGKPRIEAHISNRVKGPRRTTLVKDGYSVEMVEHILAALSGLQIDNCEVHASQQEMPGCDGSSLVFVQALKQAERVEQTSCRKSWRINSPIRIGDEKSWIQCEATPENKFQLEYRLQYHHPWIGSQEYSTTVVPDTFETELAPARTFVLEAEASLLRDQGLGVHVGYDEILVLDHDGPIQNSVRFDNECARHKTLDMLGDLALVGVDFQGKFTAFRSGHRLNAMMANAMLNQINAHNQIINVFSKSA